MIWKIKTILLILSILLNVLLYKWIIWISTYKEWVDKAIVVTSNAINSEEVQQLKDISKKLWSNIVTDIEKSFWEDFDNVILSLKWKTKEEAFKILKEKWINEEDSIKILNSINK